MATLTDNNVADGEIGSAVLLIMSETVYEFVHDRLGADYDHKSHPANMAYDNIMCNNAIYEKKRNFPLPEANYHYPVTISY